MRISNRYLLRGHVTSCPLTRREARLIGPFVQIRLVGEKWGLRPFSRINRRFPRSFKKEPHAYVSMNQLSRPPKLSDGRHLAFVE
jgi:hypothetical protein